MNLAHLSGYDWKWTLSGGVARASLTNRLQAVIPSGWGDVARAKVLLRDGNIAHVERVRGRGGVI
ncbi:MAG: hypothetical protein K0Q55_2406 [Verrucomicrobia bacterium]|nr:hypothetical protein [Verrucomicrobiota bacterium]